MLNILTAHLSDVYYVLYLRICIDNQRDTFNKFKEIKRTETFMACLLTYHLLNRSQTP